MFFRTTSSTIAFLALTAPAFADVTPAEVWQNWVDYYKAHGYTVAEGSREEAGETLSLKDVVVSIASPDGTGSVSFTMPEVTLTATGDGKVRTTVAETSPVKIDGKDDEGQALSMTGNLVLKNAEIITSGAPADMTHESKAAELSANLVTVKTDEGEKPFPLSVRFINATSSQHVVDGDLMKVDATMAADRMEIDGSFEDTTGEQPGKMGFKGGLDAIKGSGSFAVPKGVDIAKDINAALKAGMDMSGTMSAGAGSFGFDFAGKGDEGKDKTATGKSELKGFEVTGGLSAAGMKYQGSADAVTAELTATDLPFPVSYGMESATFDLQMPVMKSDQPAPFKFAYSIGGLTIADGLWDMFDAEKKLPRDPASLDIDLTGMMRVAVDLFDPAAMKAMEEGAKAEDAAAEDGAKAEGGADAAVDPAKPNTPADATADATTNATGTPADKTETEAADAAMDEPFVPTEITINKLALDAVGAKVDASGSLTVPEGGSIDAPVGKLSARLDGVNGLIDKLTAMGLIPEDQVAGIRMMLAMVAKPAPEGGDALVSEFEFKEGGQVFANGQQVK